MHPYAPQMNNSRRTEPLRNQLRYLMPHLSRKQYGVMRGVVLSVLTVAVYTWLCCARGGAYRQRLAAKDAGADRALLALRWMLPKALCLFAHIVRIGNYRLGVHCACVLCAVAVACRRVLVACPPTTTEPLTPTPPLPKIRVTSRHRRQRDRHPLPRNPADEGHAPKHAGASCVDHVRASGIRSPRAAAVAVPDPCVQRRVCGGADPFCVWLQVRVRVSGIRFGYEEQVACLGCLEVAPSLIHTAQCCTPPLQVRRARAGVRVFAHLHADLLDDAGERVLVCEIGVGAVEAAVVETGVVETGVDTVKS